MGLRGIVRRIAQLPGRVRARLQPPASPDGSDLPKAWLAPEEDALVPPRRLWIGPRDSIHHYYRWIWEYLAYLTLLCGLRRESSVLELGCGHGRTARGLLEYLRSPGRYCGLDLDRARLEDARVRIEQRYPNFQFFWADVHNAHYNPQGATRAETYTFPFPDVSFDVIYAASLFTHLLPAETRQYFRESRRVLRPGGRCLFSVFVLDHYRGHGTTVSPIYEFRHDLEPGVAVRDPEHPDALVGYSLEWLGACAAQAGLRLERLLPGLWSAGPGFAVNEQDLLLLSRDA